MGRLRPDVRSDAQSGGLRLEKWPQHTMDANASSPRASAPSETHAPSSSNTTEGEGAAEEPEPTNANNTTNGGKVKTPTKGVVKGMATAG